MRVGTRIATVGFAILLAACGAASPNTKAVAQTQGGQGVQPKPEPKPPPGFFGGFTNAIENARKARCKTAICWGGEDGTEYALEPLAELPTGKSFAFSSLNSLGKYVNNHDVSLQLAAGLRFWIANDILSFSLYLSKPILDGDSKIRLPGSVYEHPSSRVRRPYPGLALGLMADTLWFGIDVDELRNGDTDGDRDVRFPRDSVISRTVTFTLAFTPITTARNGLGALSTKDDGKKQNSTPEKTSGTEQGNSKVPDASPKNNQAPGNKGAQDATTTKDAAATREGGVPRAGPDAGAKPSADDTPTEAPVKPPPAGD